MNIQEQSEYNRKDYYITSLFYVTSRDACATHTYLRTNLLQIFIFSSEQLKHSDWIEFKCKQKIPYCPIILSFISWPCNNSIQNYLSTCMMHLHVGEHNIYQLTFHTNAMTVDRWRTSPSWTAPLEIEALTWRARPTICEASSRRGSTVGLAARPAGPAGARRVPVRGPCVV